MKICLINTDDNYGGAARATERLLCGLKSLRLDASLFVQNPSRNDNAVICRRRNQLGELLRGARKVLDLQPLYLRYDKRRRVPYSVNWLFENNAAHINSLNPDIVNLNWINAGFLRIESLSKFEAPVVWTLHDMWPFTGGCHYSDRCIKYTASCGACPILNSSRDKDLSRWTWRRKMESWRDLNLTLISPSRWLADQAKSSTLFNAKPIHIIPNGLDTNLYRPIQQKLAREILRLPKQAKILLYGCSHGIDDKRKGLRELLEAVDKIKNLPVMANVELCIFGALQFTKNFHCEVPVHFLGYLWDETSLVLAYSAADVFLAPSTQDNLPNTVMESLSCGTPCIAYNIGGMPDMIDHKRNGFLAVPGDTESLAEGLKWTLSGGTERSRMLYENARAKAKKEFDQRIQAKRYLSLYRDIMAQQT